MELTADSQDVGKAREEIPIQLEGEDIEIAFNARYLLDVLVVCETENVHLDLSGPLNPGVVRQADDEEFLYVLMPMQIL
jgi:DNA polymerase-3 subunit beta